MHSGDITELHYHSWDETDTVSSVPWAGEQLVMKKTVTHEHTLYSNGETWIHHWAYTTLHITTYLLFN